MDQKKLPIILSVPHGGREAPPEMAGRIGIGEREIYNDCDLWVDRLFTFETPPLASVTMNIARVFVDANRPPDNLVDADGAVKTITSYGVPIYVQSPTDSEKRALIDRHWLPFHRELETAVRDHAAQVRLILDCHNMAQHGPSAYRDPGRPRPLICLANLGDETGAAKGDSPTSCSQSLIQHAAESARRLFADLTLLEDDAGERPEIVALNQPFAGGYILHKMTGTVPAIMVEVNRGIFVGDQTASTSIRPANEERIAAIRIRLNRWVEDLLSRTTNEVRRS